LSWRSLIGNDIVDLAEPGVAGKERDRRFMDRVFTPDERARILEAAAPTIALWKTWTAKESAFKIASKIREGLVFRHRAFEVTAEPETPTAPRRHVWGVSRFCSGGAGLSAASPGAPERDAAWPRSSGARDGAPLYWSAAVQRAKVRFEDLEVSVKWETARDYIHCIGQLARERMATGGPSTTSAAEGARDWRRVLADIVGEGQPLLGVLTQAEQASVYCTASERVRLLARQLMQRWDLHGAEVLRQWRTWGWSPPVVVQEGEPVPEFDVSLSHDGRFVAAAVAGPGR
jgi:phosphopantetheine--protein transferase-like protein